MAIPPFFRTSSAFLSQHSCPKESIATFAPHSANASTIVPQSTPAPPVTTQTLSFKSILNGNFIKISPKLN